MRLEHLKAECLFRLSFDDHLQQPHPSGPPPETFFRHTWPSQTAYYRAAVDLQRRGVLVRTARTTTADGSLQVTLWKLAPDFDREARLAVRSL